MISAKDPTRHLRQALMILTPVVVLGCAAPQDAVVASQAAQAPQNVWVERTVQVTSPESTIVGAQFVATDAQTLKVIGPQERVIWVSGIDFAHSKLQRSVRGTGAKEHRAGGSHGQVAGTSVEVHKFAIANGELAVEALFEIDKFKAKATDRFYVEFLNAGEMSEANVNGSMSAWKKLLERLQAKGLNPKNIVLGGAKYQQGSNAIVMVKVGA